MSVRVRLIAEAVLGVRRVLVAENADFGARLVVRVDHAGALKVSELVDLARAFDVMPDFVELWDVGPNQIEIRVDLDATTPVERPLRLPRPG